MKKLLLIFSCMILVVQHIGAQGYFASASDFARLYVGAVEPQYSNMNALFYIILIAICSYIAIFY